MCPVYGTAGTEQTTRLQRQPNMPLTPQRLDQVLSYLYDLERAIVDAASEERERLQVHLVVRGTASFGASDTTKAVTFDSPVDDNDFTPLLVPSWNTKLWYSALATTGFTINVSDAPGGAGGSVRWVIVQ